ncbi:MAG: Na+/H+ antiporter subunit E, partial [Myxococcales bacterium]|nr:Na+/H+ antiporter subunit E [Myxococcales bacterium]
LAAGAVIASGVMWLNPGGSRPTRKVSWLAALRYLPWLIGRIWKSGFHVSRLILDPALPISPRFIRHKTELKSDRELVVLGNSITLTPGTITVEVAPGELLVHAIDEASAVDLTDGVFDAKIGRIFSARDAKR